MRRREFITILGGTAATWPLAARARQPGMPVIGFLRSFPPDESVTRAVRRGLNQVGYVEGKNITIEIRTAEGRYDRLPNLVADLIERQVAVILALDGPAARAAKAATSTIPIIFLTGVDPVVSGLVASIGRPEGNATGVTLIGSEINTKNLDLLCELVPSATTIGVLLNPRNSYHEQYLRAITAAATSGRLKQILSLNIATELDFDDAFANLRQQHAEGVVVTDEPFFTSRRAQLVAAAASYKLPTIYPYREFAEAGGLISYGPSPTDARRQVGIYAGRILKGDKPSDLPVIQPTKFETVLNLKTAKALGLDVPTATLLRADEVIE